MTTPLHQAARYYASIGWHVLPVWGVNADLTCACPAGGQCKDTGKHPITERGQHDATINPQQIDAWWGQYPNANIGIALAPSNLIGFDIDKPEAYQAWDEIEKTYGETDTTVQISGSGCHHVLAKRPSFAIRGSYDKRITLRGNNFIVAAPSMHKSGGQYRWQEGRAPWEKLPAALVPALAEAIKRPEQAPAALGHDYPPATPDVMRAAQEALMRHGPEIKGVSPQGHTRTAWGILVNDFALAPQEATPLIRAYNATCSPPWPDDRLFGSPCRASQQWNNPRGAQRDRILIQASLESAGMAPHQIDRPPSRSEWLETVALKSQPPMIFYSTGFDPLDELMGGGFATRQVCGVIGPPSAGKPCWEEGLVLEQARGYVRLADIRVGDRVLAHSGHFRNVTEVFEQGLLPLYTITTAAGRVVKVAGDHSLLTARGWIRADQLTVDDHLAEVHPVEDSGRDTVSTEEARLLGYLIGDGHLQTKGSAARFTNADPETLADFEHCAGALGFYTKRYACPGKAICIVLLDSPTGTRRNPNGKRIRPIAHRRARKGRKHGPPVGGAREWCRKHGIEGQTSYTKRVPAAILAGSAAVVTEYLAAYWACDGGIEDRRDTHSACVRIEAASVSEQLTKDHQKLFSKLGLSFRVRHKTKNIITRRQGDGYKVWYVAARSQDVCAKFMRDVAPRIRNEKVHRAQGLKRDDFDHVLQPDQIRTIEQIDTGRCRCLTVETDHSFAYEGVAVHNSALVGHWLLELSKQRPVLHCSTELPRYELFVRYAAHKMSFPWRDGMKGKVSQSAMAEAVRGTRIKLLGCDDLDRNDPMGSIETEIARMTQECGVSPIVADDYIQMMARGSNDQMRHKVGELTMRHRVISQHWDTAVLGVFSTSREFYSSKQMELIRAANDPTAYLKAAKESGDIEFDCATILFLDIAKLHEGNPKPGRLAVARCRVGDVGFVGLRAQLDVGKFWADQAACAEMGGDGSTKRAVETSANDCQRLVEIIRKMAGRPWNEMMTAAGIAGNRLNAARSKLLEEGLIEEAARPLNPVTRKPERGITYILRNAMTAPDVPSKEDM
jgi:replicative DNA helicase